MCSRKTVQGSGFPPSEARLAPEGGRVQGSGFPLSVRSLNVGRWTLDVECSRRRGAFTLLELLTAVAILALIVAMLSSAFKSTSDVAVRNANKTEVNQVVRAVLDQIARDLERAVYKNNALNMYQDPAMTGFWIGGAVPTNTLYFLTDIPTADGNSFGYPVNVGYQIALTNVGGVSNKWVLMRGDDPGVQPSGPCTNRWWDFSVCPFYTNLVAATENLYYWKVFSENVIGIQFKFYTNAAALYTADSFSAAAGFVQTWSSLASTNPLPYSVGVQIWTIDTESYNKALRIDPGLSGVGTNVINNNMRTYFTRVFLPSSTQNP